MYKLAYPKRIMPGLFREKIVILIYLEGKSEEYCFPNVSECSYLILKVVVSMTHSGVWWKRIVP